MNIQVELDNGKHKILKRSSDRKIELNVSLDTGRGYETQVIEIYREGNRYMLAYLDRRVPIANVIE